jgi:hypothetical protein
MEKTHNVKRIIVTKKRLIENEGEKGWLFSA